MTQDIEARLGELRKTIEEARSMPMSASAVVNRADVLNLIDRLADAVGSGLVEADEVVGDRDAVVEAGRTAAEDILRDARAESERLASDSYVFQLANTRAEEVTAAAKQEARELREEADRYVEEKLANFELALDRTLDVVRRGRARITGGHVHGLGDDSDVADMHLPDHLDR